MRLVLVLSEYENVLFAADRQASREGMRFGDLLDGLHKAAPFDKPEGLPRPIWSDRLDRDVVGSKGRAVRAAHTETGRNSVLEHRDQNGSRRRGDLESLFFMIVVIPAIMDMTVPVMMI